MFAESIASARLEWVDADGRVQVRVWDGRTGQCMQTLTGHREEIQDLAISRRRAIHSHPAALSLSFGLHFASRFALRDGASSWGGRRSGWARCHSRLRGPCALAPFPVHRPYGPGPMCRPHPPQSHLGARGCPVGRVGLSCRLPRVLVFVAPCIVARAHSQPKALFCDRAFRSVQRWLVPCHRWGRQHDTTLPALSMTIGLVKGPE